MMKDSSGDDIITDLFKEYPLSHSTGTISIENIPLEPLGKESLLGIQISEDGRVWVCINGIAFIRFNPNRKLNRGNG